MTKKEDLDEFGHAIDEFDCDFFDSMEVKDGFEEKNAVKRDNNGDILWTTRHGEDIRIIDMTPYHIENTIAYLENQAPQTIRNGRYKMHFKLELMERDEDIGESGEVEIHV